MATTQSLHWAYKNAGALSHDKGTVLPEDAGALSHDKGTVLPEDAQRLAEIAESLPLDDLSIELTLEDIEADLRYGRD